MTFAIGSYRYDLQNRLIEAKDAKVMVKYSYDPLGQRIKSVEKTSDNAKTTEFLMSGMVEQARVAEKGEMWHTLGLDLANTLNSTGGVGAYLAISAGRGNFKYLYDGNGNVTTTISQGGEVENQVVYSPFGEIEKGPELVFNYSSKTIESGLYYYGYRFYSPEMGRWLNRDPIEEQGGANLYSNRNDTINYFDILGLLNGPSKVVALSRTFSNSSATRVTYSGTNVCDWSVSGKLSISSVSADGQSIEVYPNAASTAIGDSSVTAVLSNGTDVKNVTVVRPYKAERSTPVLYQSIVSATYAFRWWKTWWIFYDQFNLSFPAGYTVNETISPQSTYLGTLGSVITGSGTTGSPLLDDYATTWTTTSPPLLMSGFTVTFQTLIIGSWKAEILNTMNADGSFVGGNVAFFY